MKATLLILLILLGFLALSVVSKDLKIPRKGDDGTTGKGDDNGSTTGEDDDDSEEAEDDDFDTLEQDKSDDKEVEFTLKSSKSGIKKEFKFRFRTEDGSGLEFKVEGSSKDSSSKIENRFELKFDRIIFYTPSGDPGYQSGDSIVSQVEFDDLDWNPITCSKENDTYTCTASSDNGLFTTNIYLVTAPVTEGGISYIPTSIKFDTIIKKESADSIALVVKIESKEVSEKISEGEDENEDDDKEIILDQGSGVFRFLPTFDLKDGGNNVIETLDVIYGTLQKSTATDDDGNEDDDDAKSITFSFETSNTGFAVWDPWFGNGPTGLKTNTSPASFLVINFSLLLAGLIAFLF